ncbi:hypothetical protein L1987_20958 [Smallanthus sonchifolius]|uniref:Uncharacterized protein n=1 Tax=Smallanthus sonchifolius TaxID=185202 RepID=A0ACB9ISJ1_9ASTR|nr:hypothetical protein L1987_20958 [Smallanthus sonchifolius]
MHGDGDDRSAAKVEEEGRARHTRDDDPSVVDEGRQSKARVLERSAITAAADVDINRARVPFEGVAVVEGGGEVGGADGRRDGLAGGGV